MYVLIIPEKINKSEIFNKQYELFVFRGVWIVTCEHLKTFGVGTTPFPQPSCSVSSVRTQSVIRSKWLNNTDTRKEIGTM